MVGREAADPPVYSSHPPAWMHPPRTTAHGRSAANAARTLPAVWNSSVRAVAGDT